MIQDFLPIESMRLVNFCWVYPLIVGNILEGAAQQQRPGLNLLGSGIPQKKKNFRDSTGGSGNPAIYVSTFKP